MRRKRRQTDEGRLRLLVDAVAHLQTLEMHRRLSDDRLSPGSQALLDTIEDVLSADELDVVRRAASHEASLADLLGIDPHTIYALARRDDPDAGPSLAELAGVRWREGGWTPVEPVTDLAERRRT